MGIHKRNNSKYWYIQFVLDGKTHVKSSKTTNRRLAERMERQWRDELLEQTALGGKKPITVGDALNKFARARRRYASHRVILSNIKHILGAIDGTKFLHEVRKKDVVRLVERLEGEEKSASTIRNVMNNFRAALNYNDSLGFRIPLLEWPHIKPARKRLRYLTLEEEQHLINELDSCPSSKPIRTWIQ